jgi:hypothetical protein
MIDEEVETVLREIREHVISQPLAQPSANGNQNAQLVATSESTARASAALARLNAHLTTTARAWDRLPPVFSNRGGTAGRIEVWIKAHLKIFSRWFTWEQVNFNAAVHHALGETLTAIHSELAEHEALRGEVQRQGEEIDALRAQLQADAATRKIDLQNQQRETNALRAEVRGELEGARIQVDAQGAELRTRVESEMAKLSTELREREDRIENEQRVCFKQLSLETNEAAVSNERGQQRLCVLREEMNERIKLLEDSAKQKPRS